MPFYSYLSVFLRYLREKERPRVTIARVIKARDRSNTIRSLASCVSGQDDNGGKEYELMAAVMTVATVSGELMAHARDGGNISVM